MMPLLHTVLHFQLNIAVTRLQSNVSNANSALPPGVDKLLR